MEVLKELQVSISEACESSFEKAHQSLKSRLAAQEAGLKEAHATASIANEARKLAENRAKDLERELSALKAELSYYESRPEDLELQQYADLEAEFSPKHVFGTKPHDVDQLRELAESKYTILYDNVQILIETWKNMKIKLLQNKKKLSHIDKRMSNREVTFMLDGVPVTFRRISSASDSQESVPTAKSHSTTSNSKTSQLEPFAATITSDSTQSRCDLLSKETIRTLESQSITQSQSPPIGTESGSPGPHSDIPVPLPDLNNRKRKRVPNLLHSQSTGSVSEQSVQVKSEPVSSSPTQNYQMFLPSTQDLDDIGGTVQTPTKRQAHRVVHWEDSDSLNSTNHASYNRPHVLQSIDGNTPKLARFSNHNSGLKKRKYSSNYTALTLAEDGDNDDCAAHSHPSRNKSAIPIGPLRETGIQSRLQDLLEGSAPNRSPLTGFRKPSTTHNSRNISSGSTRRTTESLSQAELEVRPEEEPLRSLPLRRQNITNFKINPAYNQGIDYAYEDVVRRKDDRKCLTGCTRPGCCGDRFRAMARLGAPENLTEDQEQYEQQILEEFVGDDRHLLRGLNPQERAELLVEARARLFANQWGRHRHTHQRARTPPGFWRTEMPSTQELEDDREAARRNERETIEERYREAMRPGGLWTFADE